MTHTTRNLPDLHRDAETTPERDVSLTLTGGRVLIYDSQNHSAWIVSNSFVVLEQGI